MEETQESSCVYEPATFERIVLFCSGHLDEPLTLEVLADLASFAIACVIHDTVIVPSPHITKFRYKPEMKPIVGGADYDYYRWDTLRQVLTDVGYSGFVDSSQELLHVEVPNERRRPFHDAIDTEINAWRATELVIAVGKEGAVRRPPSYPDLIRDLLRVSRHSSVDYHLKLSALAEANSAMLYLPDHERARFFKPYHALTKSVSLQLVEKYARKLTDVINLSTLQLYNSLQVRTPLFLDVAIRDAADRNRLAVLRNLADLHTFAAKSFRQLAALLTTSTPADLIVLEKEIDKLMDQLIGGGRIRSPWTRIGLEIVGFLPTLTKGADALLEKLTKVYDLLTKEQLRGTWSGLRLLNKVHYENWMRIDGFYRELERVFGKPAFSVSELTEYLRS